MKIIGDSKILAFGIGSPVDGLHEVSIFIAGIEVSTLDNLAYLPGFIPSLRAQSEFLKSTLNFMKYEDEISAFPVFDIHRIFFEGNSDEYSHIAEFHRFLELGEPNTDSFMAFLIPKQQQLHLTLQMYNSDEIIVAENTRPFELATIIDEATKELSRQLQLNTA